MLKLIFVVLLGIYGYGAWKFWKGFGRTDFNRSLPNRVSLSLLWPVLIVANKPFRRNFNKALKG
ncbi:MAG: hypothetical protein WA919_27085 [Coleofasciculaceae cyanobacterium]